MNLSLSRPSDEQVEQTLGEASSAPLTYALVGATRGDLPPDWDVDERKRKVGESEQVFRDAVAALRRWVQFDLGWVRPLRTDVPIAEGELFAFTALALGVWSINVCRVVYVIDERDAAGARFGFAYGTVGAHSVRGEERFLVEWDSASDEVAFSIRKFSRPASVLMRLIAPIVRRVQGRFTRNALDRFAAEVAR